VKPLAIWLAIVAIVFGGYAAATTLLRQTDQVFVVVDASLSMQTLNNKIIMELDSIDDRDDAEFALAIARRNTAELTQSWQPDLRWTNPQLFAPCSFDGIDAFPEASAADERILITTPGRCDADRPVGWTIIELTP